MDSSQGPFSSVVSRFVELIAVVAMYMVSELVIWGLSSLLALAEMPFLASILGMALVFMAMVMICRFYRPCDKFYIRWIKSKVDFINSHMGIGFTVPIVMVDGHDMVQARQIGFIIGAFVITSIVSWLAVFALSFYVTKLGIWLRQRFGRSSGLRSPAVAASWTSGSTIVNSSDRKTGGRGRNQQSGTNPEIRRRYSFDIEHEPLTNQRDLRAKIRTYYPIILSLTCALVIGTPVAAVTADQRVLDGCILWFLWILNVRGQNMFKTSHLLRGHPRVKNAWAAFMNPVLWTILLMLGYVRAKAAVIHGGELTHTLGEFSSGVPLYSLLTARVENRDSINGSPLYFGAGDAALSLLESGMLLWGFRMYECRRQLFSIPGLLVVLVSVASAAINVLCSVACGRLLGLNTPEALAFSARTVTLALAKPAMGAIGGSLPVNASLVVTNGILGQLLGPYILKALGVGYGVDPGPPSTTTSSKESDGSDGRLRLGSRDVQGDCADEERRSPTESDDPMIIATGTTLGINSAAMGVAYLYETKSRAAPYSALSMTIFGVMTVIFTTSPGYKDLVIRLASF